MFISDIIIKIFTKHFLTIIYSKKSHIFALGPGLHKNALGLNTVKRTKIQIRKKKSTTNQLPKKTMQRIFTPYRNQCSLQVMDEKEIAGIPWFIWKAFKWQQKKKKKKKGKVLWACKETKTNSDITFSLTALSGQQQEQNAAHLNKNLPFFGARIKSN